MSFHSIPKDSKTFKEIKEAVKNWYEITFPYEGKSYTVLGAIVGVNSQDRICLWGDVLAIDTEPQNPVLPKCFDIEGLRTQVQRGKMHGRCSNDYTVVMRACEAIYAYGPRWDIPKESNTSDEDSQTFGSAVGKRGKARIAREKLESLFKQPEK